MKHKALKLITVFTAVALLVAFGSMAFGDTVGTAEIKEFRGTVSFRYGGGFFLKIDSGEEYRLVMGPPWYQETLGLELKNGDSGSIKKGAKIYDIADLSDFDEYRGGFYCHPHGRWGGYGRGAAPGKWGEYGTRKAPRGR